MARGFKVVDDKFRKYPDKEIIIPEPATKESAGLDIRTPVQLIIPPFSRVVVATDLKAFMNSGEFLSIHIRSSVGIKKGLILTNVTGIIDMDYFENEDNDGNIHLALTNTTAETVVIEENERVAQGIFQPFLRIGGQTTSKKRRGGIGSSGKE